MWESRLVITIVVSVVTIRTIRLLHGRDVLQGHGFGRRPSEVFTIGEAVVVMVVVVGHQNVRWARGVCCHGIGQ